MANDPSTLVPLLLRDYEVGRLTGFARGTVWRMVSEGILPQPIRIPGTRAARWGEDILAAIDQWTAGK